LPTLVALLSIARDGVLASLLVVACAGAGRTLIGPWTDLDRAERLVLRLVAGMAALSFALGLLALLGAFQRWTIMGLLVVAQIGKLRRERPASWSDETRTASFAIAATLGAALPAALLFALYPPASFDDTLYHLPLARGLVEHAGVFFQPELRYPTFPLGQEVWMGAALALGGSETAVQFFSVAQLALLAAVVALWTRRIVELDGESDAPVTPSGGGRLRPRLAMTVALAPALLLGSPLFVWLGSSAYVDLAVTLYGTAALWALDLCRRSLAAAAPPHTTAGPRAWATLVGGLAGAAAIVKYNGLFFVAAAVVAAAFFSLRDRPRDAGRVRSTDAAPLLASMIVVAAVVALPWYGRNLVLTRNPVFPFAARLFGSNEWQFGDTPFAGPRGWTMIEPTFTGWAQSLRGVVLLVFDLVRSPLLLLADSIESRGGVPPLAPLAAVALPLGAALGLTSKRTRWLALVAIVHLALWLLNVHDYRFLAPATGMMGVLAAAAAARCVVHPAARWIDRTPWAAVTLVILVLVLPAWQLARHAIATRRLPPLLPEARERYLDSRLPGHSLLRCAPRREGAQPTIYGLHVEYLQYYAPGRFLGDWNGPYRFSRIDPLLRDDTRLAAALDEMGAELLLTRTGQLAVGAPFPRGAGPPGPLRRVTGCGGFELWQVATAGIAAEAAPAPACPCPAGR
jgi:hypothetical protein